MKTGRIKYLAKEQMWLRFDGSFHLSEGIQSREAVRRSPYPCITVGDAAERIFHAGRWKRAYVSSPEHGITLLGSADMLKADLSDIKLISRKYTPDMEDKKLKKGWILISCSGTIGNTVFTTKQHAEKLASQDVIRLVPNNILRAGYVYAFLSTKYGYNLLTQGTFGAVIQHIEPHNVANIPIPKAPESFQKEVDDLIQESATLREQATDALDEAKKLIYSIFENKTKHENMGMVRFGSIINGFQFRFDASYYLSKATYYESILSHLPKKKLKDLCLFINGGGRTKRYYTTDKEKGYPYLSNSDLTRANPLRFCKYSLKSRGVDDSALLKHGMIVTGRVGAVGQTEYVGTSFEENFVMCSDNVIRIMPKADNGYIFAFLSSRIGNALLWKYSTGGVQPFISPSMVGEISIPFINDASVKQANQYVEKYINSRERASLLEEKAITLVEKAIDEWNSPISKA